MIFMQNEQETRKRIINKINKLNVFKVDRQKRNTQSTIPRSMCTVSLCYLSNVNGMNFVCLSFDDFPTFVSPLFSQINAIDHESWTGCFQWIEYIIRYFFLFFFFFIFVVKFVQRQHHLVVGLSVIVYIFNFLKWHWFLCDTDYTVKKGKQREIK